MASEEKKKSVGHRTVGPSPNESMINLITARMLGLIVPQALLSTADMGGSRLSQRKSIVRSFAKA
jgi:hypothetical protein